MIQLYSNIKLLRKAKGYSQEQLALMTGYTDRSSIAKIEQGQVDLPQTKIAEFAKVFGVTCGELMGEVVPTLRSDEKQLLEDYNLLDQNDQAEIRGEIRGILRSEKYKKESRKEA